MIADSDYLLVYGTLRPAFENPFARYLRRFSRYVGEASFAGLLFDIGSYPGALFQPESGELVQGSLYAIREHKNQLLAYLDEYEGIGDQFSKPYEYVRVIVSVTCSGNSFNSWVYVYNFSTDSKKIIESGDYCQYMSQ